MHRRARRRLVALVVAALVLPVPAAAAPVATALPVTSTVVEEPFDATLVETVAPGVVRRRGTLETGTGRQVVQLFDVDPSMPGIDIESLGPANGVRGLQTVAGQAALVSADGHRVVAAINGDVWLTDDPSGTRSPMGIQVHEGELLTGARPVHPTIGVDPAGAVGLADASLEAAVTLPDGTTTLAIDRVNKSRRAGELVLYTRRWGARTGTTAGGVEVVLTGARLPLRPSGTWTATVAMKTALGDTAIPAGSLVLSARGTRAEALAGLRNGEVVTVTTAITPGWEDVREAVGGREWLVQDGVTFIKPSNAVTAASHPRTAVGRRADGTLVIAVVDGREYGYSIGVTAQELASLLRSRGAVEALMLDGGGSSTALGRRPGDREASLLNRPSDGRDRRVANGLAVVSTIRTGPLAALVVRPAGATAVVGESVPLVARGVDAALNAVSTPSVSWRVVGGAGVVATDGTFRARAPGTATITASAGGVAADATMTVVPDTVAPVPSTPTVRIVRGLVVEPDAVEVSIAWGASDVGTGVAAYELWRRVDGGAWDDVALPTATTRSITQVLPLVTSVQYQVRATDNAANTSDWRAAPAVHLRLASEAAQGTAFSGRWSTRSLAGSLGGRTRTSTWGGSILSYTFTGSQVAWIAPKGPTLGSATVLVDGRSVVTVSLRSSVAQPRRAVFTYAFGSTGTHRIAIRVAGARRVDVDGFAVVDAASPYPVIVGAGDVGSCGLTSDTATGRVIGRIPGTVFVPGDLAYESGTAAQFANCYAPAWGSFKARTRPVPGNHEYGTPGAAPYFAYFGAAAGTAGEGWYAYDVGTWRVYSLNSNCTEVGCGAGSPQETWLRADLAANPRACVAAVWHHPLFSSGVHGGTSSVKPLWEALEDAGAELVLNGHEHDYERFAPQLADGTASGAGIRELIVGTGGAAMRVFSATRPNSVVRMTGVHGVLRLELKAGGYAWRFFPVAGQSWTDTGSASCH